MMKSLKFILLSLISIYVLAGCTSGREPSPRVNVWEADTVKVEKPKRVKFKRTDGSGLIQIEALINGVPFNMWWDTGASITTISALEFVNLIKGDVISEDDAMENIQTRNANGSVSTCGMFMCREFKIRTTDGSEFVLDNVEVAVSDNVGSPLLIGQNVMRRLPNAHVLDFEGVIEFKE